MSPYRSTTTIEPAPYRLKWWRRRKAQLVMRISLLSAIVGLFLCVVLTAGCRNDAISYAKQLDPRVKCSAVNTHTPVSPSSAPDTAVCYLRLDSGRTEVWACTSESTDDGSEVSLGAWSQVCTMPSGID